MSGELHTRGQFSNYMLLITMSILLITSVINLTVMNSYIVSQIHFANSFHIMFCTWFKIDEKAVFHQYCSRMFSF